MDFANKIIKGLWKYCSFFVYIKELWKVVNKPVRIDFSMSYPGTLIYQETKYSGTPKAKLVNKPQNGISL